MNRDLHHVGRLAVCLLIVALSACGDDDGDRPGVDGGGPGVDFGPLPDGALPPTDMPGIRLDGGGVCIPQIEICGDRMDQDCDGRETPCGDTDRDGIDACRNAAEVAAMTCDCDDARVDVRPMFGALPGATEICDGRDNDCNGRIDESAACCDGCASLGAERGRADICTPEGMCDCTAAAGTEPCAAGQTCCGTGCVDITNDFANCGACGAACTPTADRCTASNCACGAGPACDFVTMCTGGSC